MMEHILVHRARVAPHGGLEPVGVWAVAGVDAYPYYPTEFAKYETRGERALFSRPPSISIEEWAAYKVATSPNWGRYEPDSFLTGRVALDAVFAQMRAEHEVQLREKSDLARETISSSDNAQGGSGWGASGWIIVQSWQIAAALVRKHPDLIVSEVHPGGGTYDALCVTSIDQMSPTVSSARSQVMLNRVGSIQVLEGEDFAIDWPMHPADEGVHLIVEQLERAADWSPPAVTSSATPRSLAYRFIAATLELVLFDRGRWDARCEFLDTAGGQIQASFLSEFPTAMEESRSVSLLGIWGEPESHFWAITRDGIAVAIVSIDGTLHRRKGPTVNLVAAYSKHNRSIRRVTAVLLAEWL